MGASTGIELEAETYYTVQSIQLQSIKYYTFLL